MESKKITVGNEDALIEKAMTEAEAFVAEAGITGKSALHIRLLSEEVLGMVKAMVGDFSAKFWLEKDEGEVKVHLDATANENIGAMKETEIMSVSTTGKNIAIKGFMAKLGHFFTAAMSDPMVGYMDPDYLYMGSMAGYSSVSSMVWSMHEYKQQLESDGSEEAKANWDELEKSIVANIADDVLVGVNKDRITLVVVKKV